jgi:hypothetical protein
VTVTPDATVGRLVGPNPELTATRDAYRDERVRRWFG